MHDSSPDICAVCSDERLNDERLNNEPWFLIAESAWEDKLKIMHWDDRLTDYPGIHQTCSTIHLKELVMRWMTTGTLALPYIQSSPNVGVYRFKSKFAWKAWDKLSIGQQIGELAVHRESLNRALRENPRALDPIVEALLAELQNKTSLTKLEACGRGQRTLV